MKDHKLCNVSGSFLRLCLGLLNSYIHPWPWWRVEHARIQSFSVEDITPMKRKRIVMLSEHETIGVEAVNFQGCEGFLPEFPKTCPKNV